MSYQPAESLRSRTFVGLLIAQFLAAFNDQAIHAAAKPDQALPSRAEEEAVVTHGSKAAGAGSGILIVGVDRLMTGLARCCKPAPPDAIVGFVTRGKGITIHRQSCSNVARMKEKQPERLISADWGTPRDEVFPVDVVVEAMDRQALLRDISEVFSREKINVTAVNTLSRNLQARMSFTLEVKSPADVAACTKPSGQPRFQPVLEPAQLP